MYFAVLVASLHVIGRFPKGGEKYKRASMTFGRLGYVPTEPIHLIQAEVSSLLGCLD